MLFLQFAQKLEIVLNMQITVNGSNLSTSSQICSNKLFQPNIGFCIKQYSKFSNVISADIIYTNANNVHYSLYTTKAQDTLINLTYSVQDLPSFALFGLSASIQLKNSNISVFIPQKLSNGCLICITCDVESFQTDYTFMAYGKNLSGLVLAPQTYLKVNQSFVQFRLNGNSGGLIYNAFQVTVSVVECNISGSMQGDVSGSLICVVSEIQLNVETVKVCANVPEFGQGAPTQTGTISVSCDLCREGYSAYGLCMKDLQFGEIVDNTLKCKNTFEFDGEICTCPAGQVVNDSFCVNVLNSVNQIMHSQQLENINIDLLTNRTLNLKNEIKVLQINIDQINVENLQLLDINTQNQNELVSSSTILQQYLMGNQSLIDINLQEISNHLEKRIQDNITILNNEIKIINDYSNILIQNATSIQKNIQEEQTKIEASQNNFDLLNSTLDNNNKIMTQQKNLIMNLSLLTQCLNNDDQTNVIGFCYLVQGYESMSCSQKLYSYSFDIIAISNSIDSNSFAKGFAFNSQIQINNAFIDVSDNVYPTVLYPLFETQSSFTNLKIQFGTQSLSSGSLIQVTSSSITISQMSIISRFGSQMQVNENSQLNILTSSSTAVNIINLQINLSIVSSGNITLIDQISGILNISGYNVLGVYNCTSTVAMIGLKLNQATINLNQVSFKPAVYNVGNYSSCLFSYATTCVFNIFNIAVILGSGSTDLCLGSISTIDSKYYVFGGIITNSDSSTTNINYVMFDIYLTFSTDFVNKFGILIGAGEGANTIQNVCLQSNITSTSQELRYIGLLGYSNGDIFIQSVSVTLSIQGIYFYCFGMIGFHYSTNAELKNLRSFVNVSPNTGGYVSSVFGRETANCSVFNASIVGNIRAQSWIGGVIGYQGSGTNATILNTCISLNAYGTSNYVGGIIAQQLQSANATISNVSISKSSVSSDSDCVGGIISSQLANTNATLLDVLIYQLTVSSANYAGGVIGSQQTTGKSNLTLCSFIIQANVSGNSNIGGIIGSQGASAYILDTTVRNSTISGQSNIGGIIGSCRSSLSLKNARIKLTNIFGLSNVCIIGQVLGGAQKIVDSNSFNNQINGANLENIELKETQC
ncbi:Conserved_hypothetical protein [Hexamita inflata]|uniref:Uncharacterized protein n=1 Tax=Hexamita inflata TaxID=28002 RepID=A0AA86PL62_9EUKA|nr:Conserved hypothetical protein [Hexamita inflata]